MKTLQSIISIFMITFIGSSHAQTIPPQYECNSKYPPPRIEAFCKDAELQELFNTANVQYIYALSKVNSTNSYLPLFVTKTKVVAQYHLCQTTGNATEFSKCLKPALISAISKLPQNSTIKNSDISRLEILAQESNMRLINNSEENFNKCIMKRISSIDDGISPARDIAQGASTACTQQASQLSMMSYSTLSTSIISQSPSLEDLNTLTNKIKSPENLIEAVLEYRAKTKKSHRKKTN